MKTITTTIAILVLSIFTISCSKNDDTPTVSAPVANTLTFKGNPITFNGLSIDDESSNFTTEYIFTTVSNLSMVFYCKLLAGVRQTNEMGTQTFTADAVDYLPVNNYPNTTVRGYVNYENKTYKTVSGQVKIKRNATGNQTIELINFKVKVGNEEGMLNGTINLPKN